jgi:hypothetical protein
MKPALEIPEYCIHKVKNLVFVTLRVDGRRKVV